MRRRRKKGIEHGSGTDYGSYCGGQEVGKRLSVDRGWLELGGKSMV